MDVLDLLSAHYDEPQLKYIYKLLLTNDICINILLKYWLHRSKRIFLTGNKALFEIGNQVVSRLKKPKGDQAQQITFRAK